MEGIMKVLITPTSLSNAKDCDAIKKLKQSNMDVIFNDKNRPLTEEEMIEYAQGCDGIIAGLDYITKKVIESSEKLKVISRYGAGYDRVDLEAATRNGVIVTNTPAANAQAVGELSISLALALSRKIAYLDKKTKEGEWVRSLGGELQGKTIGIMGLGAIGKVVAKCATGFGMNIIAHDPYIDSEFCESLHIKSVSFEDLITASDIISLHLPLNDKTKHIIEEATISKMKNTAIVINTSRGGIVDEVAMYDALKNNRLGGFGIDVFETEPPEYSPLFVLKNVIATPHSGSHTQEAVDKMADMAVTNLINVLQGRECSYKVN